MNNAPASPTPRVSVLIPVHNRENTLAETIRSVLAQTFTDFELVLCDDGSTDGSLEVARSFDDPRIRLLVNEKNIGSAATRNRLFAEGRGEYFAILDSDDVAYDYRLEYQVDYLDSHPETDVCSGMLVFMDGEGRDLGKFRYGEPLTHEQIAVRLLFCCPIGQSALMMRASAVRKHNIRYTVRLNGADDMSMYVSAVPVMRFVNLPVAFTRYRIWDNQMSKSGKTKEPARQQVNAVESAREGYRRIGVGVDEAFGRILLRSMVGRRMQAGQLGVYRAKAIEMAAANAEKGVYDQKELLKYLFGYYRRSLTRIPYPVRLFYLPAYYKFSKRLRGFGLVTG